ncbi:4'-phosphopantetheinyl transferase superfamily protein [Streptomyces sp. R302]|nr:MULTISPECIES: 4'-phosphopantetheinyl transferase superfamily protein [unclassified Streptomyces]NML55487.1 4'-phosphopantetheinyl transferase superfamily protein [Streptomyces sp. R301]NML83918.1 4'-phosphopantetheinyl transferase superfamily protein [Streptomyces sp. R302]
MWQLRVDHLAEEDLDPAELDAEERARLAAPLRAADRLRYGIGHIALRRLLAPRLGVAPAEVAYRREPCPGCGALHGRPAVEAPPGAPHFSLSHSGDVVLIGIAARPVGVDVETIPETATVHEVAAVLHPGERAEIARAGHAPEAFARVWCRKEAYLKGIGIGVARPLDQDYLGEDDPSARPGGWAVEDVPTARGHAAAVAVGGTLGMVRSSWLPSSFVTASTTVEAPDGRP